MKKFTVILIILLFANSSWAGPSVLKVRGLYLGQDRKTATDILMKICGINECIEDNYCFDKESNITVGFNSIFFNNNSKVERIRISDIDKFFNMNRVSEEEFVMSFSKAYKIKFDDIKIRMSGLDKKPYNVYISNNPTYAVILTSTTWDTINELLIIPSNNKKFGTFD